MNEETVRLMGLARMRWQRWFETQLGMLDGLTPLEAARTPEGQQKLNAIFDIYERNDGEEGAWTPVPWRWAKWKLGFGPGSAEEFAQVEFIFSFRPQVTQRNDPHEKRLEKRSNQIFIPMRCEVVGCNEHNEELLRCGQCKCVMYVTSAAKCDDCLYLYFSRANFIY